MHPELYVGERAVPVVPADPSPGQNPSIAVHRLASSPSSCSRRRRLRVASIEAPSRSYILSSSPTLACTTQTPPNSARRSAPAPGLTEAPGCRPPLRRERRVPHRRKPRGASFGPSDDPTMNPGLLSSGSTSPEGRTQSRRPSRTGCDFAVRLCQADTMRTVVAWATENAAVPPHA